MKYIVFGDVHGNLEAFRAAVDSFPFSGETSLVCLGDTVDYGADPNECMELLDSLDTVCVLGNHDAAAIGKIGTEGFNESARASSMWTMEELKGSWARKIDSLPLEAGLGSFSAVHGSPFRPVEFNYVLSAGEAMDAFASMETRLCFIGHSHVAGIFRLRGERPEILPAGQIKIEKKGKYIINAGSVGQPRDGDPRASYCIFDAGKGTVEFRRIEYDIETARKKILKKGLPPANAERLKSGR
ncbi:MAG: metallophosphoesterase [Candidatus Omnitrophica bacterium]|nr:metallophosphoesterase [Candidatus Omnitrophota bacterium]